MTVWYQVNPDYWLQVAARAGLPGGGRSVLSSLRDSLEYVRELGCTGLWLMPVYRRGRQSTKGRGSPYAVRAYDLDPAWGSEAELVALGQRARELGLGFIGEFVPNHLAPDAEFLSQHPEATYLNPDGTAFHDQNWTDTIKLDHSHPMVRAFVADTMSGIMQQYGFEGFRLDMAHYPLHGVEAPVSRGNGEPRFWEMVLERLLPQRPTLLAEVYDDRSSDMHGYRDHERLLAQGMIAYDKKTHDLLAHGAEQESFWREFNAQSQIGHLHEFDTKSGRAPFLRIPSNHDDSPGVRIYGSWRRFASALSFLAWLPGDVMVYAGEELGLTVKPSIIGADIRGQDGRLSETSQLQFRSEGDMRGMMRRLLSHRPSDMAFLQVRVRETGGMVAYVRLRPGSGELWLVAINLRNCENWGQVKDCFPTFDFPEWSFGWRELLEWAGIHGDYHLNELLQDHDMGTREVSDEIWLGLEAGGAQILRLETMA